jgi:hypothetical protein
MSGIAQAIDYKTEFVGKYFKSSATKHLWMVRIEEKTHKIELVTYKWKAKRKIMKDNSLIFQSFKTHSEFSHSFYISSHLLTVTEKSSHVDLHIDGLSFLVLVSRKSDYFLSSDEKNQHICPLILKFHSTFTENSQSFKGWEGKAKNFRLIQREIPGHVLREKVNIRPTLHITRSSTVSPDSHLAASNLGIFESFPSFTSKKRLKRRVMNFFLMI